MTTYGYVGLGEMGSAIVDRLLDSEASVTVYDLDSSRMAAAMDTVEIMRHDVLAVIAIGPTDFTVVSLASDA